MERELQATEIKPTRTAVPQLNLAASFAALREELLAEITEVCDSGRYVLGEKVAEFERQLGEYCGAEFALGLSSGTDALLLAMMALDIGPGDEVIVPTFTFFATAGCVSRLGATPVFCDIEPTTFNIDVAQVEALITPRTKAVIPVHLYGRIADLRSLAAITARHDLPIIEDAAQAIGATGDFGGDGREEAVQAAGSFGAFGCLSFYPTKNLAAIGDAGALLIKDRELFERCKLLRLHGENPRYYHRLIGGNFRIDALQAAILTIKLKHLDAWTEQRRARAARYRELFAQAGIGESRIKLPADAGSAHVYHQFVIRTPQRDALAEHLRAWQIGCGVYYPVPLHLQDCFASMGHKRGEFPQAEAAADEVLALPMYPELTDDQQRAVVEAVGSFATP